MSFTTGDGSSEALTDGQYVLAYAQFENPDAVGNYSSFTCQVEFEAEPAAPTDDETEPETWNAWSSTDQVALKNYYGSGSWKVGATAPTDDDMIASGPWVLPGDGTDSDIDWKNAMMRSSNSVTC